MEVAEDDSRPQRLNATRLHLSDYVVNSRRLGAERPANREGARNIRSVAFPLTTRIKTDELSARKVLIISLIVQGACVLTRADNRGVGLTLGVLCDAGLEEGSLELGFVGCRVHFCKDVAVGGGGDGVGAAEEGDFVGGFEDAGFVHGGLEGGCVKVGGDGCEGWGRVGRVQEEDPLVGVAGGPFEDVVADFARVAHLVYFVLVHAFLDGWRWAHPDDFGGFRGGDVQGQLGGLDVVGQ